MATTSFDAAATRASKGTAIQDRIDATLQAVIDMETGVRAFLLTGDTVTLDPWRRGQVEFATASRQLLELLDDDAHRRKAQRIKDAGEAYLAEYARPLVARRAARALPAAQTDRVIARGKRRVDDIRRLEHELEVAEQREDTAAIRQAKQTARDNRTIGAIAIGVALVVLALFAILLRRGLLLPLRGLRRAATRLSDGDLAARVEGPTSREFAPVVAALDDMAGRLAEGRELLLGDLEDARIEVLQRLARATEYRDDDTHEHTERVGCTAALLGQILDLEPGGVTMLRLAAPLHDVGKVGIPDAILLKPGRLTPEEYEEMQRHTTFGAEMLTGSRSPILQMAERIALGHHERWDGTGYPFGLSGEQTPLVARIVAVADVFDALTHERPYKEAWSVDRAVAEIESQAGKQFDPAVVAAFLSLGNSEHVRAATMPNPPPPFPATGPAARDRV